MAAPPPTIVFQPPSDAAIAVGAGVAVFTVGGVGVGAYTFLWSGVIELHVTRDGADQKDAEVLVDGNVAGVTDAGGRITLRGPPSYGPGSGLAPKFHELEVKWTSPSGDNWGARSSELVYDPIHWVKQAPDDNLLPWNFPAWLMYRLFPKPATWEIPLVNVGRVLSGFQFRARDRGNINGPFAGVYLPDVLFFLVGPIGEPGTISQTLTSNAEGRFELRDIPPGRYHLRVTDSSAIPHEYYEEGGLRILKHETFQVAAPPAAGAEFLEFDLHEDQVIVQDVILHEDNIDITTGEDVDLTLRLTVTPPKEYTVTITDTNRNMQVAGASTDGNGELTHTFVGDEGLRYRVDVVSRDALTVGSADVIWFAQDAREKDVAIEASSQVALALNVTVRYRSGVEPQEASIQVLDPNRDWAVVAEGTTQDQRLTLTWTGTRTSYQVIGESLDKRYSGLAWADYDPFNTNPQTRAVSFVLVEGGVGGGADGGNGGDGPPERLSFPYRVDVTGILHPR